MGRRRDDDDDDDDDDYDDDVRVNKKPLSGIEGMYANTNFAVLIIFSLCCNGLCLLPLILSLIAFTTSTDEKAKNNAKICLIISGVMVVIGVIANVIQMMMGGGPGGGGFR